MLITQENLKEMLHYDSETGVWTWLKAPKHNTRRTGSRAGSINPDGYRKIRIDGLAYQSSRLACLYMTGAWPVYEMDHDNRIRSDDRWSNLREATSSQNKYNKPQQDSALGLRGVYFYGDQYRVHVGKRYFGSYRFIEEAIVVRECMQVMFAGNFAPNGASP